MRFHRTGGTTGVGLLVLVLILVVLIALIVIFSQQILLGISSSHLYANNVVVLAAVVFPLSLLGIIIYQILRLVRERAKRKPGVKLKTRLIAFFSIIALLASVPLSILSISFIEYAMNVWLRQGVGEALYAGRRLALDYYDGMIENLEHFNRSALFSRVLRDMGRDPDGVWESVGGVHPRISFLQVFDSQGAEQYFRGDPVGRISDFDTVRRSILQALKSQSGSLPREEKERQSVSILRNVREHRIGGNLYHVVVGTVYDSVFDEDALKLTESLETFTQLDRFQSLFRRVVVGFYFFFTLPILLIAIFISFLLTDNLILPIVNLEEATRRVAEGDFSFRILTRTGDELAVLANSFNKMIQELEVSRKKLVHAEKVSAWQEIAQRLAHEIKNPLTPIKLSAQRILRKHSENNPGFANVLASSVGAIIEEVDNLDKLLNEFGQFAKLPGPRPEWFSLKQLVDDVTSVYHTLSGEVTIGTDSIDPNMKIRADYNQMKQVFVNLFMNAYQAMSHGGEINVRADLVKKDNASYCRIQIRDGGNGIDEDHQDKVFDPYFTTKEQGTGLGLAIVERIVFDHNGNIWFESERGVGTTFYIDLPLER